MVWYSSTGVSALATMNRFPVVVPTLATDISIELPVSTTLQLRTVIVTAGLHRGFSSELAPLSLTYRQWPGFSPYTSPFGLAGTCVFGKQSLEPFLCGPPGHLPATQEAPLVPKLRGDFAELLDKG